MTKDVPNNLELAINDVEHAFRLLEFSIRVLNHFELGMVDLGQFGQDTLIQLKEGNVTFDDGYFSCGENAELTAKIAVGASFGASAIALDNLLEATGRGRDPTSTDEFNSLWAVVYAVRNAFAHGIANPTWVVNVKYQRKIEIALNGRKEIIDLAALNGETFDYPQIGGFANWFRMKDRALTLLGR